MTRDAITRQREAYANAQAAVQPFVSAWRALDSGLNDDDRARFAEWERIDRDTTPDLYNRVKVRREIERRIGSPALELCFAKLQMVEGARDALLQYPDSGVSFEQELSA